MALLEGRSKNSIRLCLLPLEKQVEKETDWLVGIAVDSSSKHILQVCWPMHDGSICKHSGNTFQYSESMIIPSLEEWSVRGCNNLTLSNNEHPFAVLSHNAQTPQWVELVTGCTHTYTIVSHALCTFTMYLLVMYKSISLEKLSTFISPVTDKQ